MIDELAYSFYLCEYTKGVYFFKPCQFELFVKFKILFESQYKEATLLIERRNKIKKIYEH